MSEGHLQFRRMGATGAVETRSGQPAIASTRFGAATRQIEFGLMEINSMPKSMIDGYRLSAEFCFHAAISPGAASTGPLHFRCTPYPGSPTPVALKATRS